MQVQFIGVGEAFDERYANTSVLVTVPGPDGPTHVLLDCGFTAAAAYYRHANVGATLDAVWVSHFHGDHFLGLPLLLLRFWDEGRTRPLTLVGPAGIEAKLWQALELAYPGFRARLQYPVVCVEAAPGATLALCGATWSCAESDHSTHAPCLAVRLDAGGVSVFYSGDGRPTPATAALACGADLLIHEAYGLDADTPGHGGLASCLELARQSGARRLALVHLSRPVRRAHAGEIRALLARELGERGLLPEPGDLVVLA